MTEGNPVFTTLFCVCVPQASNIVEYATIDINSRSLHNTSNNTSNENSLLDSTLTVIFIFHLLGSKLLTTNIHFAFKLIKSIQENNNTNNNRSCIITTPKQIERMAKELKDNSIQLPPYIETYSVKSSLFIFQNQKI